MLQPNSEYFIEDYNKVFKKTPSADVLILGNSKVLAALSAEKLKELSNKNVLNLGYTAANLALNKMILESYLKRCSLTPELLILEVSWFSFSTRRTNFHPYFAARLLSVDLTPIKYMGRYPQIIQQIPWQIFNYVTSKSIDKGLSFKMNRIYQMKNNPHQKSYTFDPEQMKATFPNYEAGINRELVKDFHDIISLCRKNKIKLILFNAPEDAEFTMLQRDKKTIQDIYASAIEEYNLEYFDFTIDGNYYIQNTEHLLADSHHVFYTDRFTKIFYDIVSRKIQL